MGEQRRMFDELLAPDGAGLDVAVTAKALEEIAGGTSAFGPLNEWSEWFHYLLPRLIAKEAASRNAEPELSELLVTGLITQHPAGIDDQPYRGFREDVLKTLGRTLMHASGWNDGAIVRGQVLRRGPYVGGIWYWAQPEGDMSASLFLCLKYLKPEEIDYWFASVLAIQDVYWRAQLLMWLKQSYVPLNAERWQPSQLDNVEGGWAWAHCLNGNYSGDHSEPIRNIPFLEAANRQAIAEAIATRVTPTLIERWTESIRSVEDLAWEVEGHLSELAQRNYRLWPEAQ